LPVLLANQFRTAHRLQVQRVNLDSTKKRATGVNGVDAAGREFEQPASLVIASTFALNNVRMLLLSGIGAPYDPAWPGVVGRNYPTKPRASCRHFLIKTSSSIPSASAPGTVINDFAADNFDHGGLGFIGGAMSVPSTATAARFNIIRPPELRPQRSRRWSNTTTIR
jgi:gluconate 2-dehydrogenase alpha chain